MTATREKVKRLGIPFLLLAAAFAVTLFMNSLLFAARDEPYLKVTRNAPRRFDYGTRTLKVMAWNLSQAGVFEGGLVFASADAVNRRLQRFAEVIRKEQPDFLFLTDVMKTAGLAHLNQPAYLANACDMHVWSFGENYSFGVVGLRAIGGNAILSRYPLEALANPDLPGHHPVLRPVLSRRVLWCQARLADQDVLLASVHTDPANLENNRLQTERILAFAGDRPAILAGTFNAQPADPAIGLMRSSRLSSGDVSGAPTFPAERPDRRVDYIFAPAEWERIDFRVLDDSTSRHHPIVAVYRMP